MVVGAIHIGKPGDERQSEGQGLAGTGLPSAEHITPGKRIRKRVLLNGERGLLAVGSQQANKRPGHAEFTERARRLLIYGVCIIHSGI